MIDPTSNNTGKAEATETKAILIKYGITNAPVDCFHVGGFRYTNLKDAVAQARRIEAGAV